VIVNLDNTLRPASLSNATKERMLGFLSYELSADTTKLWSRWPLSGTYPEGIASCNHLNEENLDQAAVLAYDAVVALAVGLSRDCSFLSNELYSNIITSTFSGASGNVSFDSDGDRASLAQNMKNIYRVEQGVLYQDLLFSASCPTDSINCTSIQMTNYRPPLHAVWPGYGTSQPVDLVTPPGTPWQPWEVLAWVLGSIGVVLFLCVLAYFLRRCHQRARQALAAEQKLYEDNLNRVVNSAAKLSELQFTVCYVRYDLFLSHGKLLSHEEARRRGDLEMFDDFNELLAFIKENTTIFMSHQWLGWSEPDPNNVHYDAMKEAVEQLFTMQRRREMSDSRRRNSSSIRAMPDKKSIYLWVE